MLTSWFCHFLCMILPLVNNSADPFRVWFANCSFIYSQMSFATFEDLNLTGDGFWLFTPENSTTANNGTLIFRSPFTEDPLPSTQPFSISAPLKAPLASTHPIMAVHGCTMDYFNFSRYPYPGRKSIPVTWDVVVKCAFIVLIILVALVGNTLMIVIVTFSKKMRTTTNYYILNLAVADLIIACVPTWVLLVMNVHLGWVLGEFLCKFNAFLIGKLFS